ncbi:MAG: carbamoyl-phosphate synthase large subunit [Mycoplasmatales bacterium]
MPKNNEIKKVLVIGSGPIIIGQAAEFDYAGVQACLALKAEGIEVVLINSNPATIMTDTDVADHVYIEPLTAEFVERVIAKERPDSLLPTLGGQTGLNLALELDELGILAKYNVQLIGVNTTAIKEAEDRDLFKQLMERLNLPIPESAIVNDLESGLKFAAEVGYPLIIRPAYTLGGTGGGIADDETEFRKIVSNGLSLSPITQVLVEKSIKGYKEIEYEVICDNKSQAIVVCNMENINPVGVHTGDSIVVAPSQTLTDEEYQRLRHVSLSIIKALNIAGGCNVQLAQDPHSANFYIIEVNPRVSRSSALASKATGYPIAKISTLIAIGYNLDEITNPITKVTSAAVEPALDYVALKFPRFPFDKLKTKNNQLGTQMQATGETLTMDTNLQAAFIKSIRSLEVKPKYFMKESYEEMASSELLERILIDTDEQIFQIFALLRKGVSIEEIHQITLIDRLFLNVYHRIIELEIELKTNVNCVKTLKKAKKNGFANDIIAKYWEVSVEDVENLLAENQIKRVYKMVDTCAAEYVSKTSYFYSTFGQENESEPTDKQKIIVIGSGPIRIGQGIEFDYATVHSIKAIQKLGYEAIVINNNPETVSTDYELADKLYVVPLLFEEVYDIIKHEKPIGVIIQFGGQTAINLGSDLEQKGIKILGTSSSQVDACEDRDLFEQGLQAINVRQPLGKIVNSKAEALAVAEQLHYPVLCRPSFVLGGEAMKIVENSQELDQYFEELDVNYFENSILIDKYIRGMELEVDAVCDGETIFIPGIIEHVESSGIHSGDSMGVYPPQRISFDQKAEIVEITRRIAKQFKIVGLMNIQFIIMDNQIYVIEVNPRASRTVPFLVKTTKYNVVQLATNAILGHSLKKQGITELIAEEAKLISVKAPVFSFTKVKALNNFLGPEMKSTGEVMGTDITFEKALYKAFIASGIDIKMNGGVMLTIDDQSKHAVLKFAKQFSALGFVVYATKNTANFLKEENVDVTLVTKIGEEGANAIPELMADNKVNYILNISSSDQKTQKAERKIRDLAISLNIPCFSSIDTLEAVLSVIEAKSNIVSKIWYLK